MIALRDCGNEALKAKFAEKLAGLEAQVRPFIVERNKQLGALVEGDLTAERVQEIQEALEQEKDFRRTKERLYSLSGVEEEHIHYDRLVRGTADKMRQMIEKLKQPFDEPAQDFKKLHEYYTCVGRFARLSGPMSN